MPGSRVMSYLSAELLESLAEVHLHGLEHHHRVLLVLQAAQQTVCWVGGVCFFHSEQSIDDVTARTAIGGGDQNGGM